LTASNHKTRTKFFRDPIHGFIEVRPYEKAIIDSPIFQRLRRIRQLSFCYLVYHGAEHSRFGHSLGVMDLASSLYENAMRNTEELGTDSAAFDTEDDKRLRIAALLHDIGHPPFSHGLERERAFSSHEEASASLIEGPLSKQITDAGLEPKEVSDLVHGRSDPKKPYLTKMLNSQLDADRMDYLTRDSHYTGVMYGVFDIDRLLSSLIIKNGDLVVLQKGLFAADQFLIARFYMYEQVYLHRVKRAFEGMASLFARHLDKIDYPLRDQLTTKEGIAQFLKCDDQWFLNQLSSGSGTNFNTRLAKQILDRNPYKKVVDTEDIRASLTKKEHRTLQQDVGLSGISILWKALQDKLKEVAVDQTEVMFDSYRNLPLTIRPYSKPLPHETLSQEDVSPIYIYDEQTDTLDFIENKSPAIKSLSENVPRTARIYAARESFGKVSDIVEDHMDAIKKEI